jgi:hypothetical protein
MGSPSFRSSHSRAIGVNCQWPGMEPTRATMGRLPPLALVRLLAMDPEL